MPRVEPGGRQKSSLKNRLMFSERNKSNQRVIDYFTYDLYSTFSGFLTIIHKCLIGIVGPLIPKSSMMSSGLLSDEAKPEPRASFFGVFVQDPAVIGRTIPRPPPPRPYGFEFFPEAVEGVSGQTTADTEIGYHVRLPGPGRFALREERDVRPVPCVSVC